MTKLEHQLKQLTWRNRHGSHRTQYSRRKTLTMMARQLHQLGFKNLTQNSLKPKHVHALFRVWTESGLSERTQINYITQLRWWAEQINKPDLLPPTNRELGFGRVKSNPDKSKAQYLDASVLAKIKNRRIRFSLELQQEFGLRKEECVKFRPSYADQGTYIKLKSSWTKGGRPREIPVVSNTQRELLDRLSEVAGSGSMIPDDKSVREWIFVYGAAIEGCGLRNMHGLRHGYAQRRYEALAGWKCPFAGGPSVKELTHDQKKTDHEVRLTVSRELGHNRVEVTNVYLGR